jgi:pimeloyl-ACP methyl ester carboxylesterase
MILLYPAFGMYDFVHRAYPSYESISGTMEIVNDMVIGEAFGKDLWNYDVREHLSEFTKPVIIIQGTEDNIVLPSVTEQAAKLIPNCEMKLINGAGHGFGGAELDEAAEYAIEYLYKNC